MTTTESSGNAREPFFDRPNWLWIALGFTCAYAVAFLCIVGGSRTWTFLADPQSLLSNIGDFLAGVFSPIALIWLVAAVLTQRQELRATQSELGTSRKTLQVAQKETKRQTMLAHRSAEANYQLALFDRRMEIYTTLRYATMMYEMTVVLDMDTKAKFGQAVDKAAYVFREDVVRRLKEIEAHHNNYEKFLIVRGSLNTKMTDGQALDEKQIAEMSFAHEVIQDELAWITENFTMDTLDTLLLPHIQIAKSIDLPTDEEVMT